MEDDHHKGEIYLIRNKVNGKCYVGQAAKYVSKVNRKWGTIGRWKSHIREAFGDCRDHCLLLNQALRKYRVEAFEVSTTCECFLEEMNEHEKKYIEEYNSRVPNGYNLREGGSNGKATEETRRKQSEYRKGKKHSEERKSNIGKGQIGNRRGTKVRKYPEDEKLPKYITATRAEGKIVGYIVCGFPIGIETKQYISKSFRNSADPNAAYEKALAYLAELQETYSHIETEATQKKQEELPEKALETLEKKHSQNLPTYIYPIIEDLKLKGYSVQLPMCAEKSFIDNTNKLNLCAAKRYLHELMKNR
jgi:group I intron endonuclease